MGKSRRPHLMGKSIRSALWGQSPVRGEGVYRTNLPETGDVLGGEDLAPV